MAIAEKYQLFSRQTPPRSTSVKSREGKTGLYRSSAADKRGKTSLLAPATKPRATEQNVKGSLVRNRQALPQLTPSSAQPETPPAEPRHYLPDASASCLFSVFQATYVYGRYHRHNIWPLHLYELPLSFRGQ